MTRLICLLLGHKYEFKTIDYGYATILEMNNYGWYKNNLIMYIGLCNRCGRRHSYSIEKKPEEPSMPNEKD